VLFYLLADFGNRYPDRENTSSAQRAVGTKPIAKIFPGRSTGLTTGDAAARDPLPQGVVQASSGLNVSGIYARGRLQLVLGVLFAAHQIDANSGSSLNGNTRIFSEEAGSGIFTNLRNSFIPNCADIHPSAT
jgi:hypothetical protein